MRPITLIGLGRMGGHLLRIFHEKGMGPKQVFASRTPEREALAQACGATLIDDWNELEAHDGLYILAVPDREIQAAAEALLPVIGQSALVAHTSGTTLVEVLGAVFERAVLFYPLQSFSWEAPVNWDGLPVFVQARDAEDEQLLWQLAESLGAKPVVIREEQRPYLHLAAVIAHNFPNALFAWAAETLQAQGLDFEYLHPLIRQGLEKSLLLGPEAAQTGPAQRGDKSTIEGHLKLLKDDEKGRELYRLLSERINPKLFD